MIKVINVQAETHKSHSPKEAILKAEDGKDRAYKERVEKVENASFIPIIFTSKGAKSKKTARAISKIATKISTTRKEEDKGDIVNRISTDLSFLFLKMELACIRGHRKSRVASNEGTS